MWTEGALVNFLEQRQIYKNNYSIYQDKDEAYCVEKIGEEWLVCYSEREKRNELGWGKSEDQALNLLKLFLLEEHKQV